MEGAELIVDHMVEPEQLKSAERVYSDQAKRGNASARAMFDYALALVCSKPSDVRMSIRLFEQLCRRDEEDVEKRDCIYYLGVAYTRLKEYEKALAWVDILLQHEPNNNQAHALKQVIEKRMKREGLLGAAMVGGLALVGGLAGAAIVAAVASRRGR